MDNNKTSESTTSKEKIESIRADSLTDESTIKMIRAKEQSGWKVLSVNWSKKENCYIIKLKK